MVYIQSATAEIRRGEKRQKKEETTGQKYNGLWYSIGPGGHNNYEKKIFTTPFIFLNFSPLVSITFCSSGFIMSWLIAPAILAFWIHKLIVLLHSFYPCFSCGGSDLQTSRWLCVTVTRCIATVLYMRPCFSDGHSLFLYRYRTSHFTLFIHGSLGSLVFCC